MLCMYVQGPLTTVSMEREGAVSAIGTCMTSITAKITSIAMLIKDRHDTGPRVRNICIDPIPWDDKIVFFYLLLNYYSERYAYVLWWVDVLARVCVRVVNKYMVRTNM